MPSPSQRLAPAILGGAWRFAIVSLGGFGFWALESKLLPKGFGELGLYAGCLIFFVAFAELLLPKLIDGPTPLKTFNRSFVPAFLVYAIVWSALWFALRSRAGEWLGSALGCAVFAWILGRRLGASGGYLPAIAFLVLAHSVGYFLGGAVFSMRRGFPEPIASWPRGDILTLAKLAWGLFYGLGFGAGIGAAFHWFQKPENRAPTPTG